MEQEKLSDAEEQRLDELLRQTRNFNYLAALVCATAFVVTLNLYGGKDDISLFHMTFSRKYFGYVALLFIVK